MMINEYLFLSDSHKQKIQKYKPDDIDVKIYGIDETALWIASYSTQSKDDVNANKLSDVHDYIMKFLPLVLSCESSEYYNKSLFPLVNELERKLRKLLYLAASISDNKAAKESIKKLEEKDFGEIFDLLFIDQDFIDNMKIRINADHKSVFNGMRNYSKAEIQSYVDKLPENILWDAVLSAKDVPTLRYKFREVQTYRNDVMHARNISTKLFKVADNLFKKINQELDNTINNLIKIDNKLMEIKPDVNKSISSALEAMQISNISELFKQIRSSNESWSILSKAITDNQPDLDEVAKYWELINNDHRMIELSKYLKTLNQNAAYVKALRNALAHQCDRVIENIDKPDKPDKPDKGSDRTS